MTFTRHKISDLYNDLDLHTESRDLHDDLTRTKFVLVEGHNIQIQIDRSFTRFM